MNLALNEEQKQIKDTAQRFFNETAPVEALRQLRDNNDTQGYSKELWQQMAELGFAGICISEEYDGLGLGYMSMGAICECAGHTLAVSPLLSSAILSAGLIELAASETQKQQYLPKVASGEITIALALEETLHHSATAINTKATSNDAGYIINGKKSFVLDGHSANLLLVATTLDNAPAFFIVDPSSSGVEITRTQMLDNRNAARITFNNVQVSPDALLENSTQQALENTLDRARICLAAEMLGGAQEAFDRTVQYLKEREQFGVKIGSFQALKHRAAIVYSELELTRSCVMSALSGLEDNSDDIAALACLAKASANDCYELACKEAVQMHGGIGVTDELEIGFFLKRSRVAIHTLGDSAFHRDRYATLMSF